MPIFINEEKKQFHLQGKNTSYIFRIMENGQPGHLYFGKKVAHRKDFSYLFQLPNEPLGNATFTFEGDQHFSLEFLKQEYPVYGTGDFREPAIQVSQPDGSRVTLFEYESFKLVKGKPALEGLPAVYTESADEAETLEILLVDQKLKAELTLSYTVFHKRNVILRNANLKNKGTEELKINRMLSMSVDFPDAEYDLVHLSGAWIRERNIESNRLHKGIQLIDSKRGTSSSQNNPFLALKAVNADEHRGDVFGFNLVYSGNFTAGVQVDHYDTSRVFMGINPFDFSWKLEPGEAFQTPEAVMVYSDAGLNGMSHSFHDLYQNRLVRGVWRDKERPVLINNWEATYFDFNEEKILSISDEANRLGVELFVLDDGWFEGRNNDTTSLGDWTPDLNKLPNGIEGLAEKVSRDGMKFGIWVEPEMISKKSALFENHPEWVLGVQGCHLSHGRNQFILDLTRQDVRNYLFDSLSKVFSSGPIAYVKWDMNRVMTEIGSAQLPPERQEETAHRYILGLYELLERLVSTFPDILFESCASGGNRFDPGMLYYMPQTWTSDNTDAIERLKIQYGTSLVYPLSTMGAHVSSVPNHQTGRSTPLETRFHTALFGMFGYELDVTKMTDAEKEEMKKQIVFYKENRSLIQKGDFYRLLSPFEGNDTSWSVVAKDKSEALVAYYRTLAKPNPGLKRVKVYGLDAKTLYRFKETGLEMTGEELANIGLLLPPFYNGTVHTPQTFLAGDFRSVVWKLEAVK
jgi:alpha-galactosidase